MPAVGRSPRTAADAPVGLFGVRTALSRNTKFRRIVEPDRGSGADEGVRPSVPGMGRVLLDERSQPEPMTVTVAKRKA